MSRAWFFQANPKLYDVDGALASLDHIWWRVRQYASQLCVGDVVLIWRSGADPGVVGVGRITTEPQVRSAPEPSEVPFVVGDLGGPATEVRVSVQPTDLIAKATVQALPALKDHPIVVAPRGTVFPIDDEAWAQLSALVAAPPEVPDGATEDLPSAFHWRDRAKGVAPMPGGYDGYLHSLRSVCQLVGLFFLARAVVRENRKRRDTYVRFCAQIAARADQQHNWVMQGDDRGVYGADGARLMHFIEDPPRAS
jgi:predicted RNA-binding protein with PUA-like domain